VKNPPSLSAHLHRIQARLSIMEDFAYKFRRLYPWEVDVNTPHVLFPATSALELRDTFGSEGWTVSGTYFHKEVDGVEVRCLMPIHSKHPWEGA